MAKQEQARYLGAQGAIDQRGADRRQGFGGVVGQRREQQVETGRRLADLDRRRQAGWLAAQPGARLQAVEVGLQGADFDLPLQGGGDQRLAQAVVGMEYPQLQGCGFQIAHGNSGVGAVERRCPYLHIESHTPDKVPANGIRRPRRGLPKGRPSSWGEPASGRKTFFVLPCWVCLAARVEQPTSEHVHENHKKTESPLEPGHAQPPARRSGRRLRDPHPGQRWPYRQLERRRGAPVRPRRERDPRPRLRLLSYPQGPRRRRSATGAAPGGCRGPLRDRGLAGAQQRQALLPPAKRWDRW